jgi:altronate dehydratase
MEKARQALHIHKSDNVIMAIEPIAKGEIADAGAFRIQVLEDVPCGHKIAVRDLFKDEPLIKYGKTVGRIRQDVRAGAWVHCHNVDDITEQLEVEAQNELMERLRGVGADEIKPYRTAPKLSRDTVKAYRRKDGTVGVRNNVIVISVIHCANHTAERIAQATGAPCIMQEGGCLEFPDRLYHLVNSFICAGTHPNTYGVLIVSQGCQQIDPNWLIEPIQKSGREVHHLCLSKDGGFYSVVEKGTRLVRLMSERAQREERVPCPISDLVLSVHTGGSDWTSMLASNPVCGAALDIHESVGGAIVATAGRGNQIDRCGSEDTLSRMMEIGNRFRADCITRNGQGMSRVNPTPGNKAGGSAPWSETLARTPLRSVPTDKPCRQCPNAPILTQALFFMAKGA